MKILLWVFMSNRFFILFKSLQVVLVFMSEIVDHNLKLVSTRFPSISLLLKSIILLYAQNSTQKHHKIMDKCNKNFSTFAQKEFTLAQKMRISNKLKECFCRSFNFIGTWSNLEFLFILRFVFYTAASNKGLN